MEDRDRITQVWRDYEAGMEYQTSIRLPDKIRQNIAFYEGDQWAKPTERTKTLPRPVVNIIKMIVRAKRSAMNNTPVKIVYEADSGEADTQDFTHFADYIQKEMQMSEIDANAILDAAVKGGYFYHFYWDKDAHGRKGNLDGAVRCDLIDPRNIFFSNPAQLDEQKQKWIIIATREEVESVKEQCADADKEYITADDRDLSEDSEPEQEGTEMCTVLTRYFRKDGEVYCEKATRFVVFRKPFPISPDYALARRELGYAEDAANTDSPDNPLEEKQKKGYRATLFPIAVGQYEKREKCIYGMSEVEGLIPNQKCINLNLAMILLSVQNTAWSKWIVKPDALRNQDITNEPGQKLVDYSKDGRGIRQESGGQISGLPISLVDNILSYTRTVSGSTEVMTGETTGANMSGAAIAQLQAQAQQPIEELREAFWRVKEKQGRILEMFFRLFYNENRKFSYREPSKTEKGKNELIEAEFNATKYENVEFTVVAKATTGTRSSTAGDITFLDSLLKAGAITVMQYAEAYPDDALSDKERFTKLIKEAQDSELLQVKQAYTQCQEQLKQATDYLQQYQKIIAAAQSTAKENEGLRGDIALLYKRLCEELDKSEALTKLSEDVYNDATLFAGELAQNGYGKQGKIVEE